MHLEHVLSANLVKSATRLNIPALKFGRIKGEHFQQSLYRLYERPLVLQRTFLQCSLSEKLSWAQLSASFLKRQRLTE